MTEAADDDDEVIYTGVLKGENDPSNAGITRKHSTVIHRPLD